MALIYTVLAGKHDDDGENIKFIDDAPSMEAAQEMIKEEKLYTYPICRVVVTGFEAAK